MVTHYFTLHALSRELDVQLRGGFLTEVFTQHKNEVLLTIRLNSTELCLTISVEPTLNYMYVRETTSRAKKNTVDVFTTIAGKAITGVSMHPDDRILQMGLEDGLTLHAQLYNTSASNVVLATAQGVIQETFKHNRDLKGKTFQGDQKHFDREALNDRNSFATLLQKYSSESIYAALKEIVPIFGSTIAREVIHRSQIDEKQRVTQCSGDDIDRLTQSIGMVFKELENPRAAIFYRGDIPRILSVVPLQHLAGSRVESFSSVNQAVRAFVAQTFRLQKTETEKNKQLKHLKRIFDDTRRSAEASHRQLAEAYRAKENEHIGNIIMANLQHLTKGTKEIELPDIFNRERPIRITLDPKLTPVQNAKRYFEKAKKGKIAHSETERRLKDLAKKTSTLETMILHLDNCQTTEQISEFRSEHSQELKALGIVKEEKGKETPPFRVFTVSGGFEVWVGKSAANNDLLTTNYAKPNDLWFHARGASGSHTVLKIHAKAMPPPEAIRQAASIAAYYSKMRKASNVPIAYCERKYVRKPKHSPEGTVLLEREKVIFVEPGLP